MPDGKVAIGDKTYHVETWLHENFDTNDYTIGIQIWSQTGESLCSVNAIVSFEFIEDNIDNERRQEYLDKIVYVASVAHLSELIKSPGRDPHLRIRGWLKEAKKEIDEAAGK